VGSQLLDAITKATASASGPREQVEAGFAAYFRFVHEKQPAFRLLFGSGGRRDAEFAIAVRRVEEAIADAIAVLIEADIDDEHRRLLANGIVGLAEGTGRHWVGSGLDLDPDEVARRIADLAWAGLRGIRP
jgi:AcrR family transcriptional regulator